MIGDDSNAFHRTNVVQHTLVLVTVDVASQIDIAISYDAADGGWVRDGVLDGLAHMTVNGLIARWTADLSFRLDGQIVHTVRDVVTCIPRPQIDIPGRARTRVAQQKPAPMAADRIKEINRTGGNDHT
jgi:hypothetical protein